MNEKYLISGINLLIVGVAYFFGAPLWVIAFYLLGTLIGTFFGASIAKESMKKKKMNKKLNLGCGIVKLKGYINCDLSPEVKPDKIVDLEKKLPFKTNSVDEIVAHHVIEHVQNVIPLLQEMHRVCKKGAIIDIRVPHYANAAAWSDLTHCHAFAYTSLDYVEHNPQGKYSVGRTQSHEYGKMRFKFLKKEIKFNKTFTRLGFHFLANKAPNVYEAFFANIFPANEIHFILEVVK